jgi:hypothetical protein
MFLGNTAGVPQVLLVRLQAGLKAARVGLLLHIDWCKLCPPILVEDLVQNWMGMATDYDAPRKNDDDSESIEALKERVPDKMSGVVDVDDADNPGSFELAGQDLSDLDLDVVVLPPQADEFTCVECFLVKHRSQLDHESKLGPICLECAA